MLARFVQVSVFVRFYPSRDCLLYAAEEDYVRAVPLLNADAVAMPFTETQRDDID